VHPSGLWGDPKLQVDHRVEWARVKVTELANLDWLCVPCHRRKTHEGWALVEGAGKRPMVPPGDPDHPHTRRTTGTDPPRTAAA
jgi:5-methylcytosine-specific restriction endonuclease McrA